MITLILTAIISFLSSSLPNLLKFFELKARLKHELQLNTLKLEATIRNADAVKDASLAKTEVDDVMNAREMNDKSILPIWTQVILALMAPLFAFFLVGIYLWFKLTSITVLYQQGLTLDNMEIASKIVLDDTTVTILMIIIGFYFGSRTNLNKSK